MPPNRSFRILCLSFCKGLGQALGALTVLAFCVFAYKLFGGV